MDTTETLESLHPLELKVLTAFGQSEEPITDAQLIESTHLDPSQVSMAVGWLLNKQLLALSAEHITPMVSLTEAGERYFDSASPHEWILQSTKESRRSGEPVTVKDLQNQDRFQPTELSRALGLLKKDGAIRLASGGSIEATDTPSPTTEILRSLLDQLHAGPQPMQNVSSSHQSLLRQYAIKRGNTHEPFRIEDEILRSYALTPEGRTVCKLAPSQSTDEISQLTPEMLKDGSWRNHTFRKYSISLRPPRLAVGRRHPYREFLDSVKSKLVSMGFQEMRGALVETEFWDMDALYMPQFHPARAIHDVYFDTQVEICETAGFPIVYAEKIIDPSLPTVLVYGHYDVQPPDPLDLWDSPPFEPVIKDEKIYARGSADDKGQVYMHVKAYESLLKTDSLPCNLKFMIEGEEEVGSENLEIFVRENKEKLKADVIVISDTHMISNDTPSITVGLRGLSYLEVEVIGPNRDLHSGTYGGAVGNPINILCQMISSLQDKNGKITIPGFYDKVEVLSKEYRDKMAEAPFDLDEYKNHLDIAEVHGEDGFSTIERTGIRPTLDVNGIWGGYTGEGAKTVLPSKANAKISMRLVPHQDSKEITDLFSNHLKSIAPASVKIKVTAHHGGEPSVIPTDSLGYKAAERAMEKTWEGKTPIPMREGGSIPIVALFQEVLELDSILMGFGLNEDAIHSPNESYGLFNYYRGIETISHFYRFFAEMSK